MGQGVEWSIHCCALLGVLPAGRSLRLEKIAEYYDLPVPYLRKQFQALSRAGIVQTNTGPLGGYRLARPNDEISLLDIYLALEGDEPCFRCTEIRQQGPAAKGDCSYATPCSIASSMWKAEAAWRNELKKVSITQVIKDARPHIDEARMVRSQKWLEEALLE